MRTYLELLIVLKTIENMRSFLISFLLFSLNERFDLEKTIVFENEPLVLKFHKTKNDSSF